jgi:glycosyltransferase involved in cell wall biosynthesis
MSWESLNKYYLNSKIFILPSYSEGSPRVVLEALSLGVKVIASKIPGNQFPGLINNPISYFEIGDSSDLSNKILKALAQEKETSNFRFLENFNQNKIGNELISFYSQHLNIISN